MRDFCQNRIAVREKRSSRFEGRPSLSHLENRLRDQDDFSSDGEEEEEVSEPIKLANRKYSNKTKGRAI